jgi:hypothetical protein
VAGRRSLDDNDFIDRRERWRRRAVPIAAGVLVAFILAEGLDDSDGDKTVTALLVAAGVGVGVYVVTAWFRR